MLNEKEKRSPFVTVLTTIGSVLLGALLILLLACAAFNFWVNRHCFVVEVSGDSMLNTVKNGDLLYAVDRKAERGDVVIISVKGSEFNFSGDYIIKRLIAVEGDTVKCEDGVLSVMYAGSDEFTVLDEPYISSQTPEFDPKTVGKGPITVGEGQIFFLGDNRNRSYDSTEIGCLSEEDIVYVIPEWALKIKSFTTFWERMRANLAFVSKD